MLSISFQNVCYTKVIVKSTRLGVTIITMQSISSLVMDPLEAK